MENQTLLLLGPRHAESLLKQRIAKYQEQNLPDDAPLGRENATKWIAENVPGFDLILYGHDHRAKAAKVLNTQGDTVYVLSIQHF